MITSSKVSLKKYDMYKVLVMILAFVISVSAYEESKGTAGYGRVQTSFLSDKENICFKLDGAQTKYRLGNECETWLELGIYQDIKFDNGIKIHNQFRPSFAGANEASIDFVRWEEAYSEVFNILESNTMSFWLGRRYYKRYDSQISDYFLFNMSGSGLGINNYKLYDDITISYSYMFDDLEHDTFTDGESLRFYSHDIRFEKKNDSSELTFFINYMNFSDESFSSAGEIKSADGIALGLLYKSKNIHSEFLGMDGENIAAVFYGEGAAKAAGQKSSFLQDDIVAIMIDNNTSIDDAKRIRFINYNAFENDTFGVMSNIVYETKDEQEFSNINQTWFSAGVRGHWFVSKNLRFLAELGYDNVDDKISDNSYNLSKITPAIEFALDKGVWERPVLRLFYTYAKWSDSAKGMVGGDYYIDKTSGSNAGIQLEYWW